MLGVGDNDTVSLVLPDEKWTCNYVVRDLVHRSIVYDNSSMSFLLLLGLKPLRTSKTSSKKDLV